VSSDRYVILLLLRASWRRSPWLAYFVWTVVTAAGAFSAGALSRVGLGFVIAFAAVLTIEETVCFRAARSRRG
jgi:hypothetical protein